MLEIIEFTEDKREDLLNIIQPVFKKGETYAFPPEISKDEIYDVWISKPLKTFVSVYNGNLAGTYYIKKNQPGLGSHVCNCGYIVSHEFSGKGIASKMCLHSQSIAKELGFSAMQFNLVVSTNKAAVHTWKKLGFEVTGRLEKAFRHNTLGLVDAFVMYKILR